jgi:hypothetical protein
VADDLKPRLRANLEFLGGELDGEQLLLVRDPEMLAVDMAPFGIGIFPLLEYFDGENTLEDIRADLVERGAGFLDVDRLRRLVQMLDELLLLDNENSRAERSARQDYLAAPVRPAAHAGQAYPAEPDAARAFLQGMLDEAKDGPAGDARRLIAPHIDLELGRAIHGAAHRRLAGQPRPDVVVVLGVRHAAGTRRFIACRKDFATPLGTVRHDAALLDAIEAGFGENLSEGELAHRTEHSVEFQALWLAHHWSDDPPALVPLLVGGFHDFVEEGATPGGDEEIERFVAALRDAIAADGRRVVVLASVDLSHVGPIYDDPDGLDAEGEAELERYDRGLLEPVVGGDAESWFARVADGGNPRHVCGLAPVYLTLRLGDGEGELLEYGQGRIHPETGSVVSYAAVAFPD